MQNLSDLALEDTVYCMLNFCEDWHCADTGMEDFAYCFLCLYDLQRVQNNLFGHQPGSAQFYARLQPRL